MIIKGKESRINPKDIPMVAVNISLSDELHDVLVDMARLTGITKSSLAAEYVRRGLYDDVKNHKEVILLQKEMKPPGRTPKKGEYREK